eukprot:CAMPEP_0115102074 /NCGR_PEP_ID=MMETSP0227-20121206/33654_1 /TAXON_ID=89957 /ORGANISM="Polarella glacialis, Strain CCMP 1383" /LENGTH=407 /DNA_ID=CAMNT_0002498033 /DNA_START=37 /DNA_END=1261 /DNA_ORIENTATION=+
MKPAALCDAAFGATAFASLRRSLRPATSAWQQGPARFYHGSAAESWDRSDSSLKKAELWAEKRRNRDELGMRFQSDWNTARRGKPELRGLHDEIKILGRERRWEEALQVLEKVSQPDVWLRIAALSACGKALQFEAAKKVFQEIPDKNVPAYGVMMSLVGLRSPQEAQMLMEDMRSNQLEPDAGIYNALIETHGRAQNMPAAMHAFDQLVASGQPVTRATYQISLSACARTGDLATAKKLITRMEAEGLPPDAGHFTTLVTSCARTKSEDEARIVIDTMRSRGMMPDVITYTGLLSCLAGPEALVKAEAIWKEMEDAGIVRDADRCHELVSEMEALGHTRSREAQLRFAEVRNTFSVQEVPLSPPASAPASALPAGWQSRLDPSSGHHYYWREADPAGTTTWERPVA